MRGNTYSGPSDVMLCAKSMTVAGNQPTFLLLCGKYFIHLNILFCQGQSTGLSTVEMMTFGSVLDDVGVECAELCVAHSTLKQYKWSAVRTV